MTRSAKADARLAPTVSVLVCTRNRRHNVVQTAEAVLGGSWTDLELIVIDQSDDDATQDAVRPLLRQDARMRYVRLRRAGKPVALNAARGQARGRFLLLTDDDCEPAPGWAEAMVDALADDRIGCAFGAVTAAPHPEAEGYITVHPVSASCTVARLRDVHRIPGRVTTGMGACLGLQRAAVDRIGGWDPCVGPGARYWGGDDHDVAMRLNLAGYGIGFSAEASVTHYGFRRRGEEHNDYMRCGYGRGAAWMKYLRLGILHRDAVWTLRAFRGDAEWHRSQGLTGAPAEMFVEYFRRGARAARYHPLNPRTRCFVALPAWTDSVNRNRFANIVLRPDHRPAPKRLE